jgi:hypothetical protein
MEIRFKIPGNNHYTTWILEVIDGQVISCSQSRKGALKESVTTLSEWLALRKNYPEIYLLDTEGL